ncbi:hypothetical protein, partial [Streptomyces vietnamensis]|uniref:hypothetical protein n=1 Tax=Streptomyces vietnamensis TaxID=362257 RepID=UPI00341F64B1
MRRDGRPARVLRLPAPSRGARGDGRAPDVSARGSSRTESWVHSVVNDSGPVANDYNTTLEVDVFNSSA